MSIINEALKRAQKEKHPSSVNSRQILSKFAELKTDAKRSILRKWAIWTSTGAVCLLGAVLATNSLKGPAKSPAIEKTMLEVKTKGSIFSPKKRNKQLFEVNAPFHLSGILYDEEKPLAIINGYVVGENAFVNGAKLLDIQPQQVRLSFKEEELTLRIK